MKKLMVAIGAAAAAFGLYAADPNGTSFEATQSGTTLSDVDAADTTGTWAWTSEDSTATFTQTAYGSGEGKQNDDRPKMFRDNQEKYLQIKTDLTKAVFRTPDPAATYDFSDTLVKFTAFDYGDVPTMPANSKIAVWAQINENESQTNIMVTAGYWNGSTLERKDYNCGKLDNPEGWHRITIKAVKGASGDNDGFVVFLDGVNDGTGDYKLSCADAKASAGSSEWNPTGAMVQWGDSLFPSGNAGSGAQISSVGFAGQGGIDDVSVTDDVPFNIAKDKAIYTVNYPAGVTTINGGAVDAEKSGSTNFVWTAAGEAIEYTVDEAHIKANSYKTPDANGTVTIELGAAAVSVGGVGYENVADALAAINAATAATTVKLFGNQASLGGQITTTAPVTIDLNGFTVTAIQVGNGTAAANVTIVDSVGTGAVTTLVGFVGSSVTLDAGKYTNLNIQGKFALTADSTAEFFTYVDNATTIDTTAELNKLSLVTRAGYDTTGKTFKQTADITGALAFDGIGVRDAKDLLSGNTANWAAYTAGAFKGIYDGQGYAITVTLKTGDYIGLFNSCFNAEIKNLNVKLGNATGWTDATSGQVGAVIAGVTVSTTISNCQTVVNGEYNTFAATKTAGGIVGYASRGTVLVDCVNNLNITSGDNEKAGGLVAICQGGVAESEATGITVKNCTNKGNVSGTGNYSGGLVGYGDLPVTFEGANVVEGTVATTRQGSQAYSVAAFTVATGSAIVGADATFTVPAAYKTVSDGKGVDGLFFATVSDGVATLVKNSAIAVGGTYKVMAAGAAPVIELKADDTIVFDTALASIDATGITTVSGYEVKATTEGTVTTYTSAASIVTYTLTCPDLTGANVTLVAKTNDVKVLTGAGEVQIVKDDKVVVTWTAANGYFINGEATKVENITMTEAKTLTVPTATAAVAKVGDTFYPTLAAAFTAATAGQEVDILNDVEVSAVDVAAIAANITIDANGNVVTLANAAMTVSYDLTLTCSGVTAEKGFKNLAQITVAADKKLDLSALSWGAGLIGDDTVPTSARFYLNNGATYKQGGAEAASWNDSVTNIFSAVDSSKKISLEKSGDIATISVVAGTVYPSGMPESSKAAYDEWAKKNPGVDPEAPSTKEAFLLDCSPANLETEKAKFKVTSITFDGENWVVKVTGDVGDGEKYKNGYVSIQSVKATLFPTAGDNADFFQATLDYVPANQK